MTQQFVSFGVKGSERFALIAALESARFQISESRPGVPRIQVRVREGTQDEAEVNRLVAKHAPSATAMPPSTPSRFFPGYRDGRP